EGASVVFAEADEERARATQVDVGERSVAVVCDVREPESAHAVTVAATDAFGRVDVLVNNVGHFGRGRGPFHEQFDADWDDLYRVNLAHVFTFTRAVLPQMLAQGDGGSIVNISTIEAFRAMPTRAVYSAFKSGITGFTRSIAVEYARDRIRCNA